VGGVEELTFRLAKQLSDSGDAVEVWTNRHPAELPVDEVIEGIQVRRFALPMPAANPRQALGSVGGGLAAIARLRRAARAFRPDVIHVQCFSSNGVYATALSRIAGIPLVVSLQGETVMDDNDIYDHSALLRSGLHAGLGRAAAVTGCSQFVVDDAVARFGLKPGAGVVVPNGVDLAAAPPTEPLELPFGRFVFAVGRAVEKKGFDLLLRSFAGVAAEHPDTGLLIGGDGAARPQLEALARELGLQDRVALPGRLSREQVAWAMQDAGVFVLPSRVEPFGIVVLEALRAGRPSVVSSRGGAPEIVRDEREGLVVDPFDTPALTSAIGRLLSDEPLAAHLGAAGRERVGEYAWSAIGERYREIYRAVT
jgi:glycosyltransferase involved in cell wall biosynthesis